jgi:hypothetical protein
MTASGSGSRPVTPLTAQDLVCVLEALTGTSAIDTGNVEPPLGGPISNPAIDIGRADTPLDKGVF